ncbi:hypothetical protein N7467_011324 [Penicillium canescens]|nr:hypothetical protein N7467_011324 [Penicillium canescens]
MFLWLAVLIAQAYSLQSPMQYTLGGQKASQGATVLAALEWALFVFTSVKSFRIATQKNDVTDYFAMLPYH